MIDNDPKGFGRYAPSGLALPQPLLAATTKPKLVVLQEHRAGIGETGGREPARDLVGRPSLSLDRVEEGQSREPGGGSCRRTVCLDCDLVRYSDNTARIERSGNLAKQFFVLVEQVHMNVAQLALGLVCFILAFSDDWVRGYDYTNRATAIAMTTRMSNHVLMSANVLPRALS